jgi:hypothetical protein
MWIKNSLKHVEDGIYLPDGVPSWHWVPLVNSHPCLWRIEFHAGVWIMSIDWRLNGYTL